MMLRAARLRAMKPSCYSIPLQLILVEIKHNQVEALILQAVGECFLRFGSANVIVWSEC